MKKCSISVHIDYLLSTSPHSTLFYFSFTTFTHSNLSANLRTNLLLNPKLGLWNDLYSFSTYSHSYFITNFYNHSSLETYLDTSKISCYHADYMNTLSTPSATDLLADRIISDNDKLRTEQGDLPLRTHGNQATMKRRFGIASDLYADDLKNFIEKNFEILPEKNKYRLGFPTRLFSHLFSYRFMQDFQSTDFYQLGEKRVTDPRYAGRKHTDNAAFVIHAMNNLHPELETIQVNCPHSMNPKAKKKVNPYAQVRCFDRLVMREDSEFLNREILAIHDNPNHFLNPSLESWIMKKRFMKLAGQEPAPTPEQEPTGATEPTV